MNNIPRLLERHCPLWYKLLKEIPFSELKIKHYVDIVADSSYYYTNMQQLDLGDTRYCVIGEKHDFSYSYVAGEIFKGNNPCPQCYLLSDQLYYAKKERGFIFLLNKFVKHCELKHPKQIY